MKSKDLRNVVKIKRENGDGATKIFHDLNGAVSFRTIQRWVRMVDDTGAIELAKSPGRPRTARTKANIQKVKQRLNRKSRVSIRKLGKELNISNATVHSILHNDLGCFPYKKIHEPAITDLQKKKRVKFANWVFNNFKKNETNNWLFSDEKMFDLDGMYNLQNDRVWAINRHEADRKNGVKKKHQFPTKVMVWLGACRKGLTSLIILDNGTLKHEDYIRKVLRVALKCGDKMVGEKWTFQQDGASPHRDHHTQQWCAENMHEFVPYDRWPPNSPDLNPLDYSIWNELVQTMNWERVRTKATLIRELKLAVKKIPVETVLHSIEKFPVRLRLILKNKGDYIR
jgi:transposase